METEIETLIKEIYTLQFPNKIFLKKISIEYKYSDIWLESDGYVCSIELTHDISIYSRAPSLLSALINLKHEITKHWRKLHDIQTESIN
jgi:hypothetical protein